MENSKYKLITIDLDGTLLNSENEVSEENKKAIRYAIEKGIDVVLASGRITNSVFNIAEEVGADQYLIAGNGAILYDIPRKEAIYKNFIDKAKILELIKLCEDNSIYYNIYTEDSIITKAFNYNVAFYNYENSKKSEANKTTINIVQNIYDYIQNSNKEHFLKMTICDDSQIIFASILRKLKKISDIDVLEVSHMSRKIIKSGTEKFSISYFYTEVTKKNVDKWTAIEKLMELKGIKQEEVMAIGDNCNDEKMIENAGIGIAMGQSAPAIKEIANFVTSNNDENGVAEAILKMI